MLIMRLVMGNLLLFLALGPCIKSTDAQETDENITITNLPIYINTVEPTLSFEIPSTTPENAPTLLQTEAVSHNPETTLLTEINTMLVEATGESTAQPSTEQASTESVPETTTTVQTEQTTVTTPTFPVNVETTVIQDIQTSDAPSTSQYETTVGFTSPESTGSTQRPTDEITTASEAMITDSTGALDPTSILTPPPADETITSSPEPEDTSTETSTTTSTISTSATLSPQNTDDLYSGHEEESTGEVSTYFTTTVFTVIIEGSTSSFKTDWLLIIIVCVSIIFVLCVGMIMFTQWRKKKASRNFGPMYVNGQSKRSKKKKGAQDDAWAGPVNLEAGVECDAELQEGLMPNNGKQNGDDMVLSTFTNQDAEDPSDGGVGGDGTKEAKKWEEQEPLPYIDEDENEDTTGKTLEESEKQKEGEKGEEKEMNGGETFCLTTAV